MPEVLRVAPDDDRFARFRLISWWDQELLADARVLVIGAGALGNELVKNLALLGIGHLVIADFDRIEHSNLSRSVLYRPEDIGRYKADVAAESAVRLYDGMKTRALNCNVVYDLGLGLYRWADVILGGLDNREARVAMNRAAAQTGKAWIDGAIERLDGVARVFEPTTGPCYECTMSDIDWQMLEARRSCALLSRNEMEQGKVPTTPTTASVVAGIQVQEALKRLHGIDGLDGQGFCYDGQYHQSHMITYTRQPDCPTHEPYEPIEALDWSVGSTSARDLLEYAQKELGPNAVIEVNQDLLRGLICGACGKTEQHLGSLGKTTEKDALCPECGEMRRPEIYHTIDTHFDKLDEPLSRLGIPPWDILAARAGTEYRYYEFTGDRKQVLGELEASLARTRPPAPAPGPETERER